MNKYSSALTSCLCNVFIAGLVAKVMRNDSLAFHLRNRPPRTVLVERNILPQQTDDEKKQLRDAVGAQLVR